jgi:hypothetical protein
MLTRTRQFLLTALLSLISSIVVAQSVKPTIYIDSQGVRYTQWQFDSLGMANLDRPIQGSKPIQNEHETQIMFKILLVNPFTAFREKWIGKPLPPFSLRACWGIEKGW